MDEQDKKPLPRIRTYETDIETRKKEGISPSDVVAKGGILSNENMGTTNIRKVAVIAVLVLVASGIVFGLFKYFSKKEQPPPEITPAEQIGKPYIKADLEKTINFSTSNPGSLILAIKKELETPRKSESLLFLELPQTINEFSRFTGIKIPETLLKNSQPSFNIFASYHTNSSSIVFLIKTMNFEKTYGSMLSWEKDMWQSFSQFLKAENVANISRFSFGDEIIKNHDSRVLKNQEGKGILAYAIFNKQLVTISTSREGLSLILQRLIASPP